MLKATATIEPDEEGIHVKVTWSGCDLDRPCVGGFLLDKGKMKLAERLKRAINAQVVYYDLKVATDINGKTYVQSSCKILARCMNADLRRLGY